jgi:glycosyltransferase involved in cell wall biosynthesis
MGNLVKVSVAIPAYKSTFLSEAISSILNQTFSDWELIIVDDYSPNNVREIVEKYADKRIKYFRNERNVGAFNPSLNWNICLNYAKGEYFCLLCDDDLYEPTYIEEMVGLAGKYSQCNVFRARCKIINSSGEVIDYFPSSPQWESCKDYIWHNGRKLRKQTISEWMLRTDYIKKCGGYANLPFAWGADYLSIYKFSLKGGIASITKPLVAYRRSDINISTLAHKNSEQKMLANKLFEEEVNRLIDNNGLGNELKKEVIKHKILADTYILSHVSIWHYLNYIRKKKYYHINKKAILKGIEDKIIIGLKL